MLVYATSSHAGNVHSLFCLFVLGFQACRKNRILITYGADTLGNDSPIANIGYSEFLRDQALMLRLVSGFASAVSASGVSPSVSGVSVSTSGVSTSGVSTSGVVTRPSPVPGPKPLPS